MADFVDNKNIHGFIKYPEITWIDHGDIPGISRYEGNALGYRMTTNCAKGGPRKGKFTAILNQAAIRTGSGEFGYEFETADEAKAALEQEMMRLIRARVENAQKVFQDYTTLTSHEAYDRGVNDGLEFAATRLPLMILNYAKTLKQSSDDIKSSCARYARTACRELMIKVKQ